jgi:hypothetical protein
MGGRTAVMEATQTVAISRTADARIAHLINEQARVAN